ncbi:hypothetical protein [Amycolatopsis australiensis]|uniref:DUF4913 domain-containing protein n=1 Tax=Amycolatopsis australiensis TaxID=546364 RepID=A0A1K1PSB9_9PSEU|nr:hypothetical protein [Amycolatopsis australiensis]SFW50396.1 hypothetical protein SAMN04489730_0944 [Amycolatopsis australiensis]
MSDSNGTPTNPAANGAGAGQPHPGCASSTAVAGLAREVEGLRAAMEAVTPLPKQVQQLRDEVAPLPEQVKRLAKVVKTLAEQVNPDDEGGRTRPLSWLDLPDGQEVDRDPAELAQEVLSDLSVWLVRVFLRYSDAVLPECWCWHPDVVEELVWLMRSWLTAYVDADATVARAADWHDRYRPGVVKRIKAATANCSLENHQDGGERHRPGPQVPSGAALAPIAAWWGTARTSTAPEPDAEVVADARAAEAARRRSGGGRR